jgi:hypothetical protein
MEWGEGEKRCDVWGLLSNKFLMGVKVLFNYCVGGNYCQRLQCNFKNASNV